ncbi:MAG: hypothetical protein R3F61_04760 [Myxococcota bacterium]
MSRRRRSREPTWEEQHAEAKLELERAESALQYRKSQLAEVHAELKALSGPSGWFAALAGTKATYEAEAQAKIKSLGSEILTGRKRLIEARQALAKFERAAKDKADKAREREAELERFADRIRSGGGVHPLKERLAEVEGRIQAQADHLFLLDDAVYACAGLTSAIAQVARLTGNAKRWAVSDAFVDLPGSSSMTFLRTHEIRREAANVPDSVARFNAACEKLGLAPLRVEVPDLGAGWDQLFLDNLLTDLHHLKRLETFGRRLEDERDLVRDTMMWLATQRRAALEKQETLMKERHALLEGATR